MAELEQGTIIKLLNGKTLVVGYTKETVEAKIIKATQSSLGILLFDPP